jgi:hypothetical protein
MAGLDDFGEDIHVLCDCGGKTYLTYDHGDGLFAVTCEDCDQEFQVQFDRAVDIEEDE